MRLYTVIVAVFAFAKAYAQDFQGVATYQTQRHVELKMDSTSSGFDNEMQKTIQEQLRKQFQREYKLVFNANESVYKEEENLDKPQAPSTSGFQIQISGNTDILYKNTKEKNYVRQSELLGKQFLIKDELTPPEWKLEKETKNIGQYTCFKATLTEEIEERSFSSVNGEGEEEVNMVERVTTAWYTLDIPVNHGPDDFWGLPGLILEINDGKSAMMCTQVVLNPKEKVVIKAPDNGKEVDQETYDKIADEKSKEMMERMQNNREHDGNSFSIQIRG